MTVLDAYALIALLKGERAAAEVRALLTAGGVAVTAVNLAEVADRLVRADGLPEPDVLRALRLLTDSRLDVRPVDHATALRAAAIRGRRYHRTRSPLSLADCVCLAAAGEGERIATADRPLLRAAEAEEIPVIALPER